MFWEHVDLAKIVQGLKASIDGGQSKFACSKTTFKMTPIGARE